MNDELIHPKAAADLSALIGKPLTFKKDGKQREIGTITAAHIEHGQVVVRSSVSDPGIRRMLGL